MNIKCFHLVITQIRETSVGRRRKIRFLIRFFFFFFHNENRAIFTWGLLC